MVPSVPAHIAAVGMIVVHSQAPRPDPPAEITREDESRLPAGLAVPAAGAAGRWIVELDAHSVPCLGIFVLGVYLVEGCPGKHPHHERSERPGLIDEVSSQAGIGVGQEIQFQCIETGQGLSI